MSNQRMPVFFIGHGSPMNAIEDNEFSRAWQSAAEAIPKPKAIVSISAHWETRGVALTAMEKPRTIHDFYGFPQELFDVEYPAPGATKWIEQIQSLVKDTEIQPDFNWGLDHGTWSVLKRMYPKADVPVIQLSLDETADPEAHYALGRQLQPLRDKGILIIGSGNIVHNLRTILWNGAPFDWAIEFDELAAKAIQSGDHQKLIHYDQLGSAAARSINTAEHYLPLLYILGLQAKGEPVSFFNEKIFAGSLSMRCLRFGEVA
jgi:4,5-DOPA dioxygenase extradiol